MNKEKTELVTIIIPVYNTERFLKRCLNTIVNQTYKNIQIIIIDDGSTDFSGKICDEFAENDNRIQVIHKENQGVSNSRNLGIDLAKGKYINFVDSDDYLELTMIEKLVNSIRSNQADISICNYYPNKNNLIEETFNRDYAMKLILDKRYFRGFAPNKLYKKEIIGNLRFDEKIYIAEDLLFNCNYLLNCKKCSYINERLYHYELNQESASNKPLTTKYLTILDAYENLEKIYRENFEENLIWLYIDNFKICCDIIYRNNLLNEGHNFNLNVVYARKRNLFIKIIKSHDIEISKKIEIMIYNNFPIIIGKLRKIKKNMQR